MGPPGPAGPAAVADPAGPWRTSAVIDPRALPSDTSVRFLLLLAAVVSATLYLYTALWFTLRGDTFLDVVARCGLEAGELAAGSATDTALVLAEQTACRSGVSREQALSSLVGTTMVLAAAYGLYRLLPLWRTRRAHLVRLDEVDGASLHAAVEQEARRVGLRRLPTVLVDVSNPAVQGFVFGTSRHPRLGVTGGLVVLQVTDPAAFRAVLRHELAHLANRDVPWAYYTVSVWWAFVGLALVPVVAVLAVSDLAYVLRLGWRTLVLSVLVLLLRNAVLRAREAYADARAAGWGSAGDLDRVLALAQAADPREAPRHRRALRRHPAPQERRRLLRDPDGLLRTEAPIALAAGIVTGSSFESLESVVVLLLPSALALWLPALLVAPLLAVVLCVAAWRTGLRDTVRGTRGRVAGPLAVGAGLGLALGPLLSFEAAAGAVVQGPVGAVGYVVWGAGVAVVVGLLCRYAVDVGRLAVRSALDAPTPVPLLLTQVGAVSVAVAALLAYGHVSLLTLASGEPLLAVTGVGLLAVLPAWFGDDGLLVGLVAAALLVPALLVTAVRLARSRRDGHGPLAAAAAAGPRAVEQAAAGWAWRGPPARLSPDPVPVLVPALSVAAVVGLAAAGWHVVLRLAGAVLLEEDTWRSDDYALVLGVGTVAVLAAAAVVGSGAVVLLLPSRWWALGLLGAPAAVLAGGAGVLLAQWAAGCGLLPRAGPRDCSPPAPETLGLVLVQPLAYSCLWVLLGVAALGTLRGLTAAPSDAQGPARPRPGSRRVVVVGLLGLLLVAVPGVAATGFVAATEVQVVAGPGYVVTVPPPWQSRAGAQEGASPTFVTINQRLRVELGPLGPGGAAGGEDGQAGRGRDGPLVGGLPSRLVGERQEGPLVERSYEVLTPSGPYRLRVVGAPASMTGTGQQELELLLSGVEWTG
ncbi:M48 family metalloprotease [Aquipuribacter sp. MA13-6]|uniref:M48 family metalloprotease n=1 Tax=unclassified Aquipuribacter TaxID=2635084 RepID=UPI003EE8739D